MNSLRAPYAAFPAIYPEVYPEIFPELYPDDDEESSVTQKPANVWMYRRNLIGMLAFFGFFCAYTIRTNMAVAVVSMSVPDKKKPNSTADFSWDSTEKSHLLSAFYYGYVLTQILGGWVSTKIGGAKVFGAGILLSSLLALAIPTVAQFRIQVLYVVRGAQGFVQGATYPSMHVVWGRWAPPDERTRLSSMGFSGAFMGTMATYWICGLIADYLSWPYMFYIPGAVSCLWWIIWVIFVRDNPENDPWISDEELDYLRATLGVSENKDVKNPWSKFFTSMPVWAIVVSHFCQNWVFYTLLNNLPTFYSETFHYNVFKGSVLSSLPFLIMSVGLPIAGLIIDKIRKMGIFSITTLRKLFNCGAFFSQFGVMFMVTRVEDPTAVVVCLTFANGLGAFAWAAFGVNHLDIAPPHAGILMGISNMVATLSGILSSLLAGYLVKNQTLDEWKNVFLIASVFYFTGGFFYLFFGSGEKQKWVKDTTTVTASATATNTVEDEEDFLENIEFNIPGAASRRR